jgi:hypothetical protein
MTRIALLSVFSLVGCHEVLDDLDEGIDDLSCDVEPEPPHVTITPASPIPFTTGQLSLRVRGAASHAIGLAIRRITIAGLDATSDSFNFAAWSIELPADVIISRVPPMSTLPHAVTLEVIGYDPCSDDAAAPTSVEIQVADP